MFWFYFSPIAKPGPRKRVIFKAFVFEGFEGLNRGREDYPSRSSNSKNVQQIWYVFNAFGFQTDALNLL